MRFLTTRLVARLFFAGSRNAANKRLRRLFDAGLVRTWVRDFADDNVYALTPAGRDALDQDAQTSVAACPRRLDGQLDHLLAINAVRVELALSADAVIAWWRSDWELRSFASRATVPDARFALRRQSGHERTFALEVEYRTRAPRKFLTKMLRYPSGSAALSRTDDDTILVIGRHRLWLDRYRVAAASLAVAQRMWFTTLAELAQHGAAGTVWQAPDDDSRVALTDLTNRPYGNATSQRETVAVSRSSAPTAAQTYPSERRTHGTR